jgi:signal transduction histidine kinase
MKPRTASRLAWSLFGAAALMAGLALVFLVLGRSTPQPAESFGFRGWGAITAIVYSAAGALIASRRPENPMGWILCAVGVGSGLQELAQQYAIYAVLARPGVLPAGELAAWLPGWIWVLWGTVTFTLGLLLFPTGKPPSPRWGLLIWISAAGAALSCPGLALAPGPLEFFSPVSNPFGIGNRRIWLQVGGVGLGLLGIGIIGSTASLIFRFRRSAGEERQQLKWLSLAAAVVAVPFTVSFGALGPAFTGPKALETFVILALLGIPIAIGIAILRYRLYDIDIVINKALVYTALAGFITIVYVGAVIGIAALAGTPVIGARGTSGLILPIAATAIIAMAFQPVRERIQALANRLVYGEPVTPYEAMAEFSHRMAGALSLDEVLPRMAEAAARGIRADRSRVRVFLPGGGERSATWPADVEANTFDRIVTITHRGEVVGEVSVAKPPTDRITSAEEKLLSDLASQAGLALSNVRLTEELQERLGTISAQASELRASRQRIVAAQDSERRRIERDIHDGAQQQLVSMAVKLGLAKQLVTKEPTKAEETLEALRMEANEAVETLRDLARGIFPPLLADQGLVAALNGYMQKRSVRGTIQAHGFEAARFDPGVEAAIYFCCLEAIQNATKHAPESPIELRFFSSDGWLEFSVSDQGPGFDPKTVKAGSGLQNMADRIEALGGQIKISSESGRGTRVGGRVPAKIAEPVG